MARTSNLLGPQLSGLPCPWCGHALEPEQPWVRTAQERWGWVGTSLVEEQLRVGLLAVGPSEEPAAAQVMGLWVAPRLLGYGYGRRLVQSAAAGLVAREVTVLLAKGATGTVTCTAPPVDFLRAVGFTPAKEPGWWNLDLTQAVLLERPGLRSLWGRFSEALRPLAPPEPAGRTAE